MYDQFYGFIKKPFSISPDPNFIYLNSDYREALAMLQYGIDQRKGIVCLIGEVGTGKTMLINKLLESVDQGVTSVQLSCPELSYRELIEYVYVQLGIQSFSKKVTEQISMLYNYLLKERNLDRTVVLIIDEAQSLSVKMLEFLRLLSNLETSEEKLLQILLSGQPELKEKLNFPELRQFKQRIAISFQLGPLKPEEIPVYIAHRLKISGYALGLRLFTDDALALIQEYSTGIPRLINAICENSLLSGYALSKPRIDGNIIEEAAQDLMLDKPFTYAKGETGSTDTLIVPLKPVGQFSPEPKSQKSARFGSFLKVSATSAVLALILWLVVAGWPLMKKGPPMRWAETLSLNTVQEFIHQNLVKIKTYLPLEWVSGSNGKTPEAGQQINLSSDPVPEADLLSVQKVKTPLGDASHADTHQPLPMEYVDERLASSVWSEEIRRSIMRPSLRGDKPNRHSDSELKKPPEAFAGQSLQNPEATTNSGAGDPGGKASTALQPELKKKTPIRIIRSGDTAYELVFETYGFLTPHIWGLVHLANPAIDDLNMIFEGSVLHLPPLAPESMIFKNSASQYIIYLNAATDLPRARVLKSIIQQYGGIEVYISFAPLSSDLGLYLLQAGRFATHQAALVELKKLSKIPLISKIMEARHEPNI